MITLYDYEYSANCYKVRLMLAVLGLQYHLVPIDIYPGDDHLKPPFLDLNPLAEVPVLVDSDVTLTDAHAILVRLAEDHDAGRNWLPPQPALLPLALQWLGIAARLSASSGAARMALAKTEEIDLEALRSTALPIMRMIDEHLWFGERMGHEWLLPPAHPTVADIACFPDLALCEEAGISRLDYPAIRRWIDRVRRIDGFIVMSGIFPASPGLHRSAAA